MGASLIVAIAVLPDGCQPAAQRVQDLGRSAHTSLCGPRSFRGQRPERSGLGLTGGQIWSNNNPQGWLNREIRQRTA